VSLARYRKVRAIRLCMAGAFLCWSICKRALPMEGCRDLEVDVQGHSLRVVPPHPPFSAPVVGCGVSSDRGSFTGRVVLRGRAQGWVWPSCSSSHRIRGRCRASVNAFASPSPWTRVSAMLCTGVWVRRDQRTSSAKA
jgi:hypothetical protein